MRSSRSASSIAPRALREQGVRYGMTIRQALSRCPEAEIVPPDPVLYRTAWETVLAALGEVSPEVEDEELGRAYVNVKGLEHHYRDDEALASHIIEVVLNASGLEARRGDGRTGSSLPLPPPRRAGRAKAASSRRAASVSSSPR